MVTGCEPVGLAVIACFKLFDAGPVLAADYSPKRRTLTEKISANKVIDPSTENPYENNLLKNQKIAAI